MSSQIWTYRDTTITQRNLARPVGRGDRRQDRQGRRCDERRRRQLHRRRHRPVDLRQEGHAAGGCGSATSTWTPRRSRGEPHRGPDQGRARVRRGCVPRSEQARRLSRPARGATTAPAARATATTTSPRQDAARRGASASRAALLRARLARRRGPGVSSTQFRWASVKRSPSAGQDERTAIPKTIRTPSRSRPGRPPGDGQLLRAGGRGTARRPSPRSRRRLRRPREGAAPRARPGGAARAPRSRRRREDDERQGRS